jgi:TatD DNase family protein
MLKFIDTHCHPQYLLEGKSRQINAADFLTECFEHLDFLLMVAVSIKDFSLLKSIASLDSRAHMSAGIHPSYVHESDFKTFCEELFLQAQAQEVVALGETGLDYYHSVEHKKIQQELFDYHLHLGQLLNKPIIVHTRNAAADTLNLLKSHPNTRGVIHCFTENKDFAKAVLDLNWMISFSGIITFKNAQELREVVAYVPEDCLLSETDAPYLAPIPFRGKENIPIYVRYVTEQLALLKNKSIEDMVSCIKLNYQRFLAINTLRSA